VRVNAAHATPAPAPAHATHAHDAQAHDAQAHDAQAHDAQAHATRAHEAVNSQAHDAPSRWLYTMVMKLADPAPVAALAERRGPDRSVSPAGPARDGAAIHMPPSVGARGIRQSLRYTRDPLGFHLDPAGQLGDAWVINIMIRDEPMVVTCHPDHVKALFTASPDEVPSMTGESPLRPVLGPGSVLTLLGEQHMRHRKLLLPSFHGSAVARYIELISDVAEREIDSWPVGRAFSLAPRMQALTLDVIMGGIFGMSCPPQRGSDEWRLRETLRAVMRISTHPLWPLVEWHNRGAPAQPRGVLRAVLWAVDRQLYAAIARRRAAGLGADQTDVLSLLLQAHDEDGRQLSDRDLRDELLTLVLAGHETTANSLAWTVERLLRTPAAYERLRGLTRSDDPDAGAYVEATIQEGMRMRPVIPMIGRRPTQAWQLGDYVVPAKTPVLISIVALHHRPDVYERPHAFSPERFVGQRPGTYTWIPFGGSVRRCLGVELAMAEQRIVLRAIAERTDMFAPDPTAELARQRNVTMIPQHGGRVVVAAKHRPR
jgi:cytochrome P450